jgi:hypothetical protein
MKTQMLKHNLYFSLLFLWATSPILAQEQDLGTESVTVVKSYAPVILIGAKPIIAPILKEVSWDQKRTLTYRIKEFPVASNFIPQLAAPDALPAEKAPKSYNTLVHLGLGSRSTAALWADSQIKQSRYAHIGLQLMHNSMVQDLPEVDWDSNFFDTQLHGSYYFSKRKKHYQAGASLQHMAYSWYGMPIMQGGIAQLSIAVPVYDLQQNYVSSEIFGSFRQDKGALESLSIMGGDFRDATQSNAQKINVHGNGRFMLGDKPLFWNASYDFRSGQFSNPPLSSFDQSTGLGYQIHKVALNPVIELAGADAFFKLGSKIIYSNGLKIYPDIYGEYALVTDFVNAFARLSGDFNLNDYASFVQENPFVSPSLEVLPSDQRYAFELGVKGGSAAFSYTLSWMENSTNNQALFVQNPKNYLNAYEKQFNYGNSFEVVYDAIDTQRLGIVLEAAPFQGLSLSGHYHRFDYTTTPAQEAWHLPKESARIQLEYHFLNRFTFNGSWNYTGVRTGRSSQMVQFITPGPLPSEVFELPGFHRLDAQLFYQANDRLSVFVKGSNLTGSTYALWSGFVAPPRIVMAGAQYRFNL